VASFFVFIHHYPLDYFPFLHEGYLAKPTDTSLLQLPFVRIVYSGRFMVGLFFVLSGYVLSYRPLQLIREGNTSALLDNLASSVFRRAIRLFLPVVLSTYVVMLLGHNGWYGSLNPVIKVPAVAPLGQQTLQWLSSLESISNIFLGGPVLVTKFSNQLWTLPTEFHGSMLIFVSLLALSKAKTGVRMSLISLFALYSFYTQVHWDMALFFSGILVAELRLVQNTSPLNWDNIFRDPKTGNLARSALKVFWTCMFLLSWFLACWPDYSSEISPGYIFFSSITPAQFPGGQGRTHFWTSIAAVLMLVSLENNPVLQQTFTTPIAMYLGDISFALYIVHIPICYSVGRMITVAAIDWTGMQLTGFLLGALAVAPLVLWTADVYWRLVDAKSVEFARWVWVKSCKSPVSK
jgi:peptidoglycan/LPS O-acetylase OafA/YrhL